MHAYHAISAAAGLIVPEVILLLTMCLMFVAAPFLASGNGQPVAGLKQRWGILALLALGAAAFAWVQAPRDISGLGPFRSDELVWFIRGITLLAGGLLTLLLWDQVEEAHSGESFACLLAILAGVNFVALANDLVGIFLGLELVSIPTYVLLHLGGQARANQEATIKYFLLSVFSSAILLFGLAWIFGLVGTTNLTVIAQQIEQGTIQSEQGLFRLALVLLIGGLCFRLAAVPFHFYAPDVFQGVNPSNAGMLSLIPKVVGFAALLKLLPVCAGTLSLHEWMPVGAVRYILTIVAVLTMFLGNLLALRQTNLYRLLAYSSIAHAGYMLVGLIIGDAAAGTSGLAALLYYLSVYGVMTLGVFALIASATSNQRPLRNVSELAGLSQSQPVIAFLLAICIFGLAGLPPTGGFLAKLNLFLAAWSEGTREGAALAIILAINAVIAAAYYLRLIATMYFDPASISDQPRPANPATVAGVLCAAGTLLLFLVPQWLWAAASAALH